MRRKYALNRAVLVCVSLMTLVRNMINDSGINYIQVDFFVVVFSNNEFQSKEIEPVARFYSFTTFTRFVCTRQILGGNWRTVSFV